MFCNEFAAPSGCVTTNQMSKAIARNPTILLTFTRTTVRPREETAALVCTARQCVTVSGTRADTLVRMITDGERDVPCVGGLAYDGVGRLLLVRRRNDPGRGRWSLPGGRVERGEDHDAALVREMAEETGLRVRPGALVGTLRRGRYLIADYRCAVLGGVLRAGDDAADARWVGRADLAGLPLVDGLVEVLTGWDALPD